MWMLIPILMNCVRLMSDYKKGRWENPPFLVSNKEGSYAMTDRERLEQELRKVGWTLRVDTIKRKFGFTWLSGLREVRVTKSSINKDLIDNILRLIYDWNNGTYCKDYWNNGTYCKH